MVGISSVSGEDFGYEPVKILVFPSPIGYMLWSFGIPSISEVNSIGSSKMIVDFPDILNFNRFYLKTQAIYPKLTVGELAVHYLFPASWGLSSSIWSLLL